MAPSPKRKKKSVSMAKRQPQVPDLGLAEECPNAPEKPELGENLDDSSEAEQKNSEEDSGDELMPSSEKEEEQTFLVNLYKFMKERHTPIERVPHLGFKQINLFKIYKAVEKLGAYELVTGRRLWKNVYDMLGGSPGSTSAATCTRRHYERLVLPYVRHLKGEDDKPLPPIKPRKQYKVSKEPKGAPGGSEAEKKRTKKKARDRNLPEQLKQDAASASKSPNGTEQLHPQEPTGSAAPFPSSREVPETQPTSSCLGNCSEPYSRLVSSFYIKGNHGIMSPLAKKKLLAQVSQDETFYSHERHLSHCPEYKKFNVREVSGSDSEAGPRVGHPHKEALKAGLDVNGASGPPGPSPQVAKAGEVFLKGPLGCKEGLAPAKGEGDSTGAPPSVGPQMLSGYFSASRSSAGKPISGVPLRGPVKYFPGLKDFSEPSPAYQQPGKDGLVVLGTQRKQEGLEDQPEDLRKKPSPPSWKADNHPTSTFLASPLSGKRCSPPFPAVKTTWVPPVANLVKVSPQVPLSGGRPVSAGQAGLAVQKKRPLEEGYFLHGKKLKAVSPFVKEAEPSSGLEPRSPSPSGQQGVAKPKAAVAGSGFPATPGPQIQDVYEGAMLRLPVNFSHAGEHLKDQFPSLIQSLSISPFIIPAFPTPLLTASIQASDLGQSPGTSLVHYPTSYDSTLRHRLYPVSTWHSQPAYVSPQVQAYHRNTKL